MVTTGTVRRTRVGALAIVPVAIVVLVPLLVDRGARAAFLAPKWTALAVLVPAGLAVTAWRDRLVWPAWRPWVALLAVASVATVLGVSPWTSLLGAPQRNMGLVAWVLGAGAFVLGASVGRHPQVLRAVVRATVLAGGVVAAVAVLEALDVDVVGYGDLATTDRVRSTWGSATFLAAYLVLIGPVVAGHLRAGDPRWRWTARAATALGAVALIASGTRGAWLGAAAAALVVGWPALVRTLGRPEGRRRVAGLALGVLVAVGALIATSDSVRRPTAAGRLDLWSVAVSASLERPLLGGGPDSQRVLLPGAIDEAFERRHGHAELHDRAHQLVLDTTLGTGVVGLVALGALLWAVGARLRAALARGLVARAIVAGAVAYLVQLTVSFSEASLDPLAWLFVGLAVGLAADPEPAPAPRRRAVAVGALVVLTLVAGMWSVSELVGEHHLERALGHHAAGDVDGADAAMVTAVERSPHRVEPLLVRARMLLDATPPRSAEAVAALRGAVALSPEDPELLTDLARALTVEGETDEARRVLDAVVRDAYPNSSRAWRVRAELEHRAGNEDLARRHVARAEALVPTAPTAPTARTGR